MQLVAVAHVLAEHQRETIDEALHGLRRQPEHADRALLAEDDVLGPAPLTLIVLVGHDAFLTSVAVAGGVLTLRVSSRSSYHGRSRTHDGFSRP